MRGNPPHRRVRSRKNGLPPKRFCLCTRWCDGFAPLTILLSLLRRNANTSHQLRKIEAHSKVTSTMNTDYKQRSLQYGFASPEEVQQALNDPNTVVLDVRTEEEIAEDGKVQHTNWKQTRCTPTECPTLSIHPEEFVKDKDATIVVYCKSGRRASKAKEILEAQGYHTVLNAGGYGDVAALM